MKKLSLFYTSRFLFQSKGPDGRHEEGHVEAQKPKEKRTAAEIRESQKATVREIYATQRERVRAFQGKKKVAEKYPGKEARVIQSTMVIKTNGMPDHVDPNDTIKILDKGQVYEIGGAKYVRVEVSGRRGPRGAARRFAAYMIYEPSVDDKGQKWDPLTGNPVDVPSVLRDTREKEGSDLIEKFANEVQAYIDKVAAPDRFQIVRSYFAASGGKDEVKVLDLKSNEQVVSWMMLDNTIDNAADHLDESGMGASPVFVEREHRYGKQSAATAVMGKPSLQGVPDPDKRVRLGGSDTMHYSLADAVNRAKAEIDYYLEEWPLGFNEGSDDVDVVRK